MTSQSTETILINGEACSLMSEPLRAFLAREGLPALVERWSSTMTLRGYIGTWQISDGKLLLVGIEDCSMDGQPYERVSSLLEAHHGRLLADWYTGSLRIGQGNFLGSVGLGMWNLYERELHIGIASGHVISQKMIHNDWYGQPSYMRWRVVKFLLKLKRYFHRLIKS